MLEQGAHVGNQGGDVTGDVHEAARLASTLAARDQSGDRSTSLSTSATQIERTNDWNAIRQLKEGTRILVTTSQDRSIRGRTSTVSEDALRMIDRQGHDQMLRREDVREVRLDHRLSVGQYVGLGLLIGGWAGVAIGRASECDCELRGLGTAMGAISGTIGGAIGGWMIGDAMNARPRRLIYRVPQP